MRNLRRHADALARKTEAMIATPLISRAGMPNLADQIREALSMFVRIST